MTTAIATRAIPTRRIEFEYEPGADSPLPAPGTTPRHFMGGDPVMSHIVAVLSSLFPEGEDFFVRSVRNYRDRITDPELKRQVAGFIGQESIHGREHRDFNDFLAGLGYPTHFVDRATKHGLALLAKVAPKTHQLAVTAALEHYTATLAEVLLREDSARAMFGVDEIRHLFTWHALEESEHKAVAYDVFETVSGKRRIRVGVMAATHIGFLSAVTAATVLSLLLDRSTYRHPVRTLRSLGRLRRSPFLTRQVVQRMRDYNRAGFHPDHHETDDLLEEWRTRLFADGGALEGRVKGRAA